MRTADREDGSLIVDAAVCLPVFLIAAALLLLLLMQAGTEDTVMRSCVAAAQGCVEAGAAVHDVDPETARNVIQAAFFAARMHSYLSGEWKNGPDTHVRSFLPEQKAFVSARIRADHLVWVTVSTQRKAAFSLGKTGGIFSLRSFVFRPWEGESEQAFPADDERVYVFPKYGEKYHSYGCRIMKEGSVEAILTEALKRRCRACKTCRPSSLPYGSIVFLFSDGSRVYHRKECPCITKYYVSMPKGEAQAEGYAPCLFCQDAP